MVGRRPGDGQRVGAGGQGERRAARDARGVRGGESPVADGGAGGAGQRPAEVGVVGQRVEVEQRRGRQAEGVAVLLDRRRQAGG